MTQENSICMIVCSISNGFLISKRSEIFELECIQAFC